MRRSPFAGHGSGWLRFPPPWETSGLSLAASGLPLTGGRLRSRPIAAWRGALAELTAPAGLGFPPLWETSVWCVMCGVWAASLLGSSWGRLRSSENAAYRRGLANLCNSCNVWCMMCVGWCVMCVGWCVMCVVLCCVVVLCGVWCAVVFCSFLPFAPAVCYSKRGPNIKEYWEKTRSGQDRKDRKRRRGTAIDENKQTT